MAETPTGTFDVPSFPDEFKGNSAEGNPLGDVGNGSHAAPMRDRDGAGEGMIPPFQK